MAKNEEARRSALEQLRRLAAEDAEPAQVARPREAHRPPPPPATEIPGAAPAPETRPRRRPGTVEVPESVARDVGRRALRTETAEHALAQEQARASGRLQEALGKLAAVEETWTRVEAALRGDIEQHLRERNDAVVRVETANTRIQELQTQIDEFTQKKGPEYDAAIRERDVQIRERDQQLELLRKNLIGAGLAQQQLESQIAELRSSSSNASKDLELARAEIEKLNLRTTDQLASSRQQALREAELNDRIFQHAKANGLLEARIRELAGADERAKKLANENSDMDLELKRKTAELEHGSSATGDLNKTIEELRQKSTQSGETVAAERAERTKNVKELKDTLDLVEGHVLRYLRDTDDIHGARAAATFLRLLFDLLKQGDKKDRLDPGLAKQMVEEFLKQQGAVHPIEAISPATPPTQATPVSPEPQVQATPGSTGPVPDAEAIRSEITVFFADKIQSSNFAQSVPATELRKTYIQWSTDQGKTPINERAFFAAIDARGINKIRIGKLTRYFGIAIRP